MKTRLIFLFCACFQMYNIYGQNPLCVPDTLYKDSIAGIYPRPYNDSTKTGGISKPVCINQDYEFPLTVRVPDMIAVPFGTSTIVVALESATLDPNNAVIGLPKGIQYFCNPPGCTMAKNVLGCIVLKGKATTENTPGVYGLVINLKLVTSIGTLDVSFPGPFFPGIYFMNVLAANNAGCATSPVVEASAGFESRHFAFPNPAKDLLNIQVLAMESGEADILLQDISGKNLKTIPIRLNRGDNAISIPVQDLNNGSYVYTLKLGKSVSSKRFVILK
ncbi:MAG: T9SS type A sorting domain-containing protein [Saprospiraceae bacterium]|nr:T9SS type A sorting domain-containing protein [Saprospiraceae bacterium]